MADNTDGNLTIIEDVALQQTADTNIAIPVIVLLTAKQMAKITEFNLDLETIKNLQTVDNRCQYKFSGWNAFKAGSNFVGSVFVGTREMPGYHGGEPQKVYLKDDGWFTTSDDLTNCDPIKDKFGKVIQGDNGYEFADKIASEIKRAVNGGKSRKNGKRKLKRKTKRRHRK